VTWYGASKLAGEAVLEDFPDIPSVVIRPPAVYGPGERDLFSMFKAVKGRVAPLLGLQRKKLSFVFADDLVDALLVAATQKGLEGSCHFVAHEEIVSDLDLLLAIEEALGKTAWKPRLPMVFGWILGALGTGLLQPFMNRPPLMSFQRMKEIAPTNWVCDGSSFSKSTGFVCQTPLKQGVMKTAAWYRKHGWL